MSGHGEARSAHCRRRGGCKAVVVSVFFALAVPLRGSHDPESTSAWIRRSDAYSAQVVETNKYAPRVQPATQRSTTKSPTFVRAPKSAPSKNSSGCFRNCEHSE